MVSRAEVINKLGEFFPKSLASLADAGKRWSFLPPQRIGPKLSRDDVVRMIRESGAFDEAFYRPLIRTSGKRVPTRSRIGWISVQAQPLRLPSFRDLTLL
jgi:hypothetical protein